MCVIAVIPKGQDIPKDYFRACAESNPHGFGFMFRDGTQLRTFKTLRLSVFWDMYRRTKDENPNAEFALHFRIATSGGVNLENQHPFPIGPNIALMHNGIIRGYGNKRMNDTRHFILAHLDPYRIAHGDDALLDELPPLGEQLGAFNRLVIMSPEKTVYINREHWEEFDGVLYSNTYWLNYGLWRGE